MSNVLAATERSEFKGSVLTKLRQDGYIPAVVYGSKNGSTAISIDSKDLIKTVKEVGRNGIISLDLQGEKYNVMLTDYQKGALKNEIFHVDFLIVDMSEEIEAEVRVNLVGTAQGVKDGGVLQQSIHTLTVSAKPNEIPETIDVDVSGLQVGDTLTIADIKGQYKLTADEEEVIASVLAPRQEEEISTGEQQDGGIPDNVEGRETEAPSES